MITTRTLILCLGLGACSSPEGVTTFRGEPVSPDRFGLVLLLTGDEPPALTEDERREAFAAHQAFMGERAARGELLVAGPFGEPKDDPELRGLFLFDEGDPEALRALGGGDPTTAMGVFRQEAMTLDTLDLVRWMPELLAEREEERRAAGDTGEYDLASYTVMLASDGPGALRAAGNPLFEGRVALLGRLGPPREDALFGVFTVPDPEEVRARLAASGLDVAAEGLVLSRWYATPVLRQFAGTD